MLNTASIPHGTIFIYVMRRVLGIRGIGPGMYNLLVFFLTFILKKKKIQA